MEDSQLDYDPPTRAELEADARREAVQEATESFEERLTALQHDYDHLYELAKQLKFVVDTLTVMGAEHLPAATHTECANYSKWSDEVLSHLPEPKQTGAHTSVAQAKGGAK